MIENLKKVLKKYWGYDDFLPLQQEAMISATDRRDSVVVLPTGGGKSLCYQAPAMMMDGLAIVVSPLISLMKDQVDALTECGIAAARLDSSLSQDHRDEIFQRIGNGQVKILYLSPERIMAGGFMDYLKRIGVSMIAIDEAHCVSMWGHDFRPEYRQLGRLKETLGSLPVHAYTATATDQVRGDISVQLKLENPNILVGSFDRPNLIYRIQRRSDKVRQVCKVLDRHKNESGIVYCITRKNVDELSAALAAKGYSAAPYHAGMNPEDRRKNQDLFITEKIDTIVATIAFGMGIDKSNVRYVIHTGMPKSLENYQQESGRAGRDGLEAECCMFYSGEDYRIWKIILGDAEGDVGKIAMSKLSGMSDFCSSAGCRHQTILNYFGQSLDKDNCSACDMCLGEVDRLDDPLEKAQKILSCVIRLEERFGSHYTTLVLTGSKEKRILEFGHDNLSTYGILSEHKMRTVRDWVEQLIGQGYLEKTGEFNVLHVTPKGWEVLRGDTVPRLLKPAVKAKKVSKVVKDSWEGVDEGLFEVLRQLRKKIAGKKGLPAFVVFGDAALRDMARRQPTTHTQFLEVKGVGEAKDEQYGAVFIKEIGKYTGAD